MRDRLIDIIKKTVIPYFAEFIADDLIADGWIRPPCKVGQTVWLIKSLNRQCTEWGIKEGNISMIQQKADKSWKFRVTENHSVKDYTVDKIGKTVFFTKEEAEQALTCQKSRQVEEGGARECDTEKSRLR